MSEKIYIALSTFAQHGQEPVELLRQSGFSFSINSTGKRLDPKELIAQAQGATGIVAGVETYDEAVLMGLPNLRCISRCGVGIDNIDLKFAKERGISVLNTPDVVIQPVAELTLAMALDLLKKITFHTELMRQNNWQKITGKLLKGRTIGIIGMGRIGRKVAELFLKMDAKVCVHDLYPDLAWASEHQVKAVSLEELLRSSDIITLHLSATEGAFCLGDREFGLMKKGACLINTARGQYINERSMIQALKAGHLSGAALDVFDKEPYSGELNQLPNVLLSPHVATLTEESRLEMEVQAVLNLIGSLKERKLSENVGY